MLLIDLPLRFILALISFTFRGWIGWSGIVLVLLKVIGVIHWQWWVAALPLEYGVIYCLYMTIDGALYRAGLKDVGGYARFTQGAIVDQSRIQEIISDGPERIGATIDACCEDPNRRQFAQSLLDAALEPYFLLQLAMFANKKVSPYVTIKKWSDVGLKLPAEGTPEFFPYEAEEAALKFECPTCGQHISATPAQIGNTAPCPNCSAPVTVPNASALPPQLPSLPTQSALPEQEQAKETTQNRTVKLDDYCRFKPRMSDVTMWHMWEKGTIDLSPGDIVKVVTTPENGMCYVNKPGNCPVLATMALVDTEWLEPVKGEFKECEYCAAIDHETSNCPYRGKVPYGWKGNGPWRIEGGKMLFD